MRKNRRKSKVRRLAKVWAGYRLARRGPYLLAMTAAGAVARHLWSRRRGRTKGTDTVGPAQGETTPLPGMHSLSLHRAVEGDRFDDALEGLRNQLGPRAVGEPDENGFFEVEVEAESWDGAAARVRDAIAAAGADEAVELGEPSGRPGAQA